MKTKFKYSDLEDSSAYYDHFFEAIHNAGIPYILGLDKDEKTNDRFYKGWFCYKRAFIIIETYNRVCMKLFAMGEMLVGVQLIRMQLDILTAIYADTKWPFDILCKNYWQGKQLDKIKKIKPGELRKEIDAKYNTNICELYDLYSSFVHPNINQITLGINPHQAFSMDSERTYSDDLEIVNQTIGNILADFVKKLKNETNWEVIERKRKEYQAK